MCEKEPNHFCLEACLRHHTLNCTRGWEWNWKNSPQLLVVGVDLQLAEICVFSASTGSEDNSALHKGLLWPIKDMQRAYLKQQHTSPGQTNSLHTPSASLGGRINTLQEGQRRGRMREEAAEQRSERTYLPSNLCFKKSNSAFCIMSVTWGQEREAIRQTGFCWLFPWSERRIPHSPSVMVQLEPQGAWKAQRRTVECVPSSGEITDEGIYGNKVNIATYHERGLEQEKQQSRQFKSNRTSWAMKRVIWESPRKHRKLINVAKYHWKTEFKIWYFMIGIFRWMLQSHGSDVLEWEAKEERLGGEKSCIRSTENPTQGGSFVHRSWTKVGAQCVRQLYIISHIRGGNVHVFPPDVSILVSG